MDPVSYLWNEFKDNETIFSFRWIENENLRLPSWGIVFQRTFLNGERIKTNSVFCVKKENGLRITSRKMAPDASSSFLPQKHVVIGIIIIIELLSIFRPPKEGKITFTSQFFRYFLKILYYGESSSQFCLIWMMTSFPLKIEMRDKSAQIRYCARSERNNYLKLFMYPNTLYFKEFFLEPNQIFP